MTEHARLELNGLVPVEGALPGQRKMMETWIVLELCNRGSLQVQSGLQLLLGAWRIESIDARQEVCLICKAVTGSCRQGRIQAKS